MPPTRTPTTQETDDEFTLAPLSIPAAIHAILRLNHQAHTLSPLQANAPFVPEAEFIANRKPFYLPRFADPGIRAVKITLAAEPERIVSYVIFVPPAAEPDRRGREEREEGLRRKLEGLHNKDLIFALKTEALELNERYLGKGYEARYWELAVLVTDVAYQRRGLGTRLVKWGVERVVEEEEGRRGRVKVVGEGEEGTGEGGNDGKEGEGGAKGIYLIASPEGARTYEKAGFVRIGERKAVVEGVDGGYVQGWYVKLFDNGNE